MSAESGVPTFREAQSRPLGSLRPGDPRHTPGLGGRSRPWSGRGTSGARGWCALPRPMPGIARSLTLARLRDVRLVTQNVDDLHERAGSDVLAHLHGSLFSPRCSRCGTAYPAPPVPEQLPGAAHSPALPGMPCSRAARGGVVRRAAAGGPVRGRHGGTPRHRPRARRRDLRAGLPRRRACPCRRRASGVPVVEVNPEDTALSDAVHHTWRARAAHALPALVASLAP